VVSDLRSSLRVIAAEIEGQPAERLCLLRRAIGQRRAVRFRYWARDSDPGAPQDRAADPYALVHLTGAWYLSAFDHRRRALRNFRLDRMDELRLLPDTFTRPADFRVVSPTDTGRNTVVRVLFDPGSELPDRC